MQFHLANKFIALRHAAEVKATHMLSILDPGEQMEAPAWIAPTCRLRVDCYDLANPTSGYVVPGRPHAQAIIDFARRLPQGASVLVHCHAGTSRSPAAIILCLAARAPGFAAAARDVRAFFDAHDFIRPNPLLVAAGDEILGFGGRLKSLVQKLDGERLLFKDRNKPIIIEL